MSALMSTNLPSMDYGVGVGVAVLLAGLIGLGVTQSARMPLQLDIYGDPGATNMAAVRETVLPHLGGGFFALDSAELEARLQALPWVREVEVQRLWPDRLAVNLRSYEPLAAWRDEAVLTRSGVLIWPDAVPSLALRIDGPHEQAAAAYEDLQVVLPALPQGWALLEWRISRTGDRAASVMAADHTLDLEFGREPVAEKFQLLADVVVPELGDRWVNVAAVDLRYRNGFAVRWRDANSAKDKK